MLHPFDKALVSVIAILVLLLLTVLVIQGTKSPDCEHLYNEYSNTTNVQLQQALMNKGVMNGCFHGE